MKFTLYFNRITVLLLSCFAYSVSAQVITKEDSLNAGLVAQPGQSTVVSSYGNAYWDHDLTEKSSTSSMERVVFFMGHRFNKNILFFSELELENARVENGNPAGEISLEQAFVKFNVSSTKYFVAGLFIPRIGIINENHLPTTFSSVHRPIVETLILPATWREIGVSYYAQVRRMPGLNISAAVMNGLNAQNFVYGTGIKEGSNGGFGSSKSVAATAAVLYYIRDFRFQVSAYCGGTSAFSKREADSVGLGSNAFSQPVALGEANAQYHHAGWIVKALATYIAIPDANKINTAFANNTPQGMTGIYGELGYDLLQLTAWKDKHQFVVFTRYEHLNMNSKVPDNGISSNHLKQDHFFAGFCYLPIRNVIIKVDYHYSSVGDVNPLLQVNPFPNRAPFYNQRHMIETSVGWSF